MFQIIRRRTVTGVDAAFAAARATDVAGTGLAPDKLEAFRALRTRTEKVVTVYGQGVNQSSFGTDKVNAILNCHLATGRIGRPGMGPFSVTGQPNAMGGREVGGLANMLACHLDIENPTHRKVERGFWASPATPDKAGLKEVDMFRAVGEGRIRAIWIIHTNPVGSMPEADVVAEALRGCPFVVVQDVTADTDTAQLAHPCGSGGADGLGWGVRLGDPGRGLCRTCGAVGGWRALWEATSTSRTSRGRMRWAMRRCSLSPGLQTHDSRAGDSLARGTPTRRTARRGCGGGWRAELAGKTRPGDWVSAARAHFGLPQTAVLSVTDQVRGRGRVAFHRDGRLVAALFAGPVPIALARDQLAARLGLENPQDALAGRARADMPDPGPTVCVCATVGLNTIRHAVESGRATSLAALGESLGAGASCGSCSPKLAGPIARFRQRDVAE